MERDISSILKKAKEYLCNSLQENALDAELMLSFIINESISYIYTWGEKKVTKNNITKFQKLVNRRKKGEPLEYLISYTEFWSHKLKVNHATLIPRNDTETLIESLLNIESKKKQKVLELGTGSGAISIAIASERKNWDITAIDISEKALVVAKENASSFGYNIKFIRSNWFEKIEKDKKFDIIISNPPYISKHDKNIYKVVKLYEPEIALFSENNGLKDIEVIVKKSKKFLESNGLLFLEHGFKQRKVVSNILKKYQYRNIISVKDLSGNDRVIIANA